MISDECHRSQLGEMHTAITKAFKHYHLFYFTGTFIFSVNAASGGNPQLKTTEQAFGKKLHAYIIGDFINDENIVPFRIDYINALKMKDRGKDKKIHAIDGEAITSSPQRIAQVTNYILENFEQKTERDGGFYDFSKLMNTADVAADKEKDAAKKIKEIRNKVRLNRI